MGDETSCGLGNTPKGGEERRWIDSGNGDDWNKGDLATVGVGLDDVLQSLSQLVVKRVFV